MDTTITEPIDATSATSAQLPMRCSPAINELTVALAKAQGQFPVIEKDKQARIQTKSGAAYSYSYADLSTILAAIRKPLSENALAIMQPVHVNGRSVSVTTIVAHGSGQWVADALDMPIGDPTDARSLASAVTYARRYGLIAMLGIAPAHEGDDDAAAATPAASVGKSPRRPEPVTETSTPPLAAPVITEAQRKKFFAVAGEQGWTTEQLKPRLRGYGVESTKLIPQHQYDELLDALALERPGCDRIPGEEG